MSRIVRSSKRSVTVGGGQTLRGQFVSGKTVSRSFVYINHGKFRIVGPFTRPSQAPLPPFTIILRASARLLRLFFEWRREPIGFVRERPPAAVVCPYLTATTMLTRLELVTNPTMLSIDHWSTEEGSGIRCLGQREEETDRRFFPSVERRMEILRPL